MILARGFRINRKNHMKPQFFFWIFILITLGFIFVFFIPPFQKADENTHFFRAASLYEGEFSCKSTGTASDLYVGREFLEFNNMMETSRIAFHPEEKFKTESISKSLEGIEDNSEFVILDNYCTLPILSYIPYILTFSIGDYFSSIILSFYLSRIVSFTIFCICIVLAYKNLRDSKLRWIVILYSIIPMVLHQASSFGPDYLQLAISPLLFSYVYRLSVREESFWKYYVIISCLSVLFIVTKFGYFFIPFIFFLTPPEKIGKSIKEYILKSSVFISIIGITSILSFIFIRNTTPLVDPRVPGSDSLKQLAHLFDLKYLFLLYFNTLSEYLPKYTQEFWGVFGWLDYSLPFYIYSIFTGLTFFLIFSIYKERFFKDWKRILLISFLTLISSSFLIGLALYLTWTPVGHPVIEGIQGRYFLVLFPTVVVLLSSIARGISSSKTFRLIIACLIILSLFYGLINTILIRYWI